MELTQQNNDYKNDLEKTEQQLDEQTGLASKYKEKKTNLK